MTDLGRLPTQRNTQSSEVTNLCLIIKEGAADCISYKSTILSVSWIQEQDSSYFFAIVTFYPSLVSSRGSFGWKDINSKFREIVCCDPHLRIKDLRQRHLDVNPSRFVWILHPSSATHPGLSAFLSTSRIMTTFSESPSLMFPWSWNSQKATINSRSIVDSSLCLLYFNMQTTCITYSTLNVWRARSGLIFWPSLPGPRIISELSQHHLWIEHIGENRHNVPCNSNKPKRHQRMPVKDKWPSLFVCHYILGTDPSMMLKKTTCSQYTFHHGRMYMPMYAYLCAAFENCWVLGLKQILNFIIYLF